MLKFSVLPQKFIYQQKLEFQPFEQYINFATKLFTHIKIPLLFNTLHNFQTLLTFIKQKDQSVGSNENRGVGSTTQLRQRKDHWSVTVQFHEEKFRTRHISKLIIMHVSVIVFIVISNEHVGSVGNQIAVFECNVEFKTGLFDQLENW